MTKRPLILIAIPVAVVVLLAATLVFVKTAPQEYRYYYDRHTRSLIAVSSSLVNVLHRSGGNGELEYQVGPMANTIEATISSEFGNNRKTLRLQIYLRNEGGGYDLWHLDTLESQIPFFDTSGLGFEERKQTPADIRKVARELTPENVYALEALVPAPKEAAALLEKLDDATPQESLTLVDQLLNQYPDDLFLNILKLDVLAENKKESALSEALDQFADKFTTDNEDLADYAVKVHRGNLLAYESIRKGINIQSREMQIEEGFSTDQLSRLLLDFEDVPNFQSGVRQALQVNAGNQVPNFLIMQTFTKTQRVLADFYLMSGNPEEARDLTFRLSRLGIGMMGTGEDIITHLIGVAVLSIATATNANLYVDGYTDAESLERSYPSLMALHDAASKTLENPILDEHPVVKRANNLRPSQTPEIATRGKTALTRLALATTAASIRHYQLLSGNWPTTPSAGILLEKALTDPFSEEGLPLRIAAVGDDMMVYSIGPDQEDGGGSVEYDPTNGTFSAGDITLSLFHDRKYRFPSEPIKSRNRAEFLALYPNGLLPDPFADTRGRSYIISDTTPPVLWSVGPDVDEREMAIDGMMSDAPQAGYGAASTLEGQWMHFVNEPEQATYDPTNGTISDGNIYWEF